MNAEENYYKKYKMINFERKGIFELLEKEYGFKRVLYPGCSIHITPSFYFQHVIFLDKSAESREFFLDQISVKKLISKNKVYRLESFFQFISGDFEQLKLFDDYKFDLLISLYADDVVLNCEGVIKTNAMVLSNNFHDEARNLQKNTKYSLKAVIRRDKGKYKVIPVLENFEINHRDEEKMQKECTKNINGEITYVDNEIYYLFEFSG